MSAEHDRAADHVRVAGTAMDQPDLHRTKQRLEGAEQRGRRQRRAPVANRARPS